jgi:hypothetical protein
MIYVVKNSDFTPRAAGGRGGGGGGGRHTDESNGHAMMAVSEVLEYKRICHTSD